MFVEGIELDDDKIIKVKNWLMFLNLEDVCRFFGFVGYYWKFIMNFFKIVWFFMSLILIIIKFKKINKKKIKFFDWNWGKE